MNEYSKGKITQDLVHLLVRHDPTASDEVIAEVVSEWGDLMAERSVDDEDFAKGKDTLGETDGEA